MILTSKTRALLAGLLLGAAGIVTAQAQTLVTFSVDMGTNIALGTFTNGVSVVAVRGTFNGFTAAGVTLVQDGTSSIYTNTVNATNAVGTIMQFLYKDVTRNVHETRADGQNRGVVIPAGGTLVLGTPFFNDSGAKVQNSVTFQVDISQQIALGVFTNGASQVSVRATAIGFVDGYVLTNNPAILRTNQFGLVTSNVYMGTFTFTNSPWASLGYKFYLDNNTNPTPSHTPGYEGVSLINQKAGGNRNLYMNSATVLPVVDYGDSPYAPISQVRFSVDMSVVALTDPTYDASTLTINGAIMGWGGVPITNNPAAANTNIYSGVFAIGAGTYTEYQYRYQGGSGTVYDHLNGGSGGSGNRFYTATTVASTNLPTVNFNDVNPTDVLLSSTLVTFKVDLNGAVGTDSYVWVPGDSVFVNGPWPTWESWNPISLTHQLIEIGSGIYSNTFSIPAGVPVGLTYKYGINGVDNEAGSGQNRSRIIRSTVTGEYAFAQDKFGSQYNEPSFGQLAVGPASGGTVPLTWLGRPGVKVQSSSSVSGGSWVTYAGTDGTNWTAGTSSTNGLVSSTNWPTTGGSQFFRLIKQ